MNPHHDHRPYRHRCYHTVVTYLRASYRLGVSPTTELRVNGFRVVEVLEPATLLLLGLAGVAVARRRARRGSFSA